MAPHILKRDLPAVSSLALTAPTGLYPGNLMLANLSQSDGTGPTIVSLRSAANKAPFAASGTSPVAAISKT
jgi:hypothetical protein